MQVIKTVSYTTYQQNAADQLQEGKRFVLSPSPKKALPTAGLKLPFKKKQFN